ncbi:MAG: CPBP family intramembrane metalloprotease [Anaerolineales bacterium]|nr:CPBP family intramembrane metalloprotease [Anaerolineales bacterium]
MTVLGIKFDLKITIVIILGTLLPLIDLHHHTLFSNVSYNRFFLYLVVPAVVILLVFKEPLKDYGFQWGNWKEGIAWTLGSCLVMALVLIVFMRRPELQAYYRVKSAGGLWRAVWDSGVDLFGWEFLWRGFTLFALARVTGPGTAIWLQAVPFTFAHLGKPEIETMSCIFGGAGFGLVAWRSKSFVYPFLIHTFIASWTTYLTMGG